MRFFGDYHTHTTYSHGKDSILDNVIQAKKAGLKEIAITEHGPEHFLYPVKLDAFKKMREEIDKINDSVQGIKVLLGVEANIVSLGGDIDLNEKILPYMDVIAAGFHMFSVLRKPADYYQLYFKYYAGKLVKGMKLSNENNNTIAMISAIENYPISFISHPNARVPINVEAVARAAASKGTFLEINEKGNELKPEDIRIIKNAGAGFIVNSDAHKAVAVGNFSKSAELIKLSGLEAADIVNANYEIGPIFRR